jgi:hypothetical protein
MGVMLADMVEGYNKHEVFLLYDIKNLIINDHAFEFDENSG